MSELAGVWVSVTTGTGTFASTNDHLYLGIGGTVGGREFSLDVNGFDDWERGTEVNYGFGPAGLPGDHEPTNAADQLERLTICLPNVTHVYLRKQGDRTPTGDDYWELEDCQVHLTDGDDQTRLFTSTGTARLGNEFGHTVWLAETGHGDGYADARVPVDGVADCESDTELG